MPFPFTSNVAAGDTATATQHNNLRKDILFALGAGDQSDGAPTWTSGASLDPTLEYNYTTATLPVSQSLSVSSVNSVLRIKNSGDVTINGTVDLNGKGGAGGGGGARNTVENATATSGTAGTAGNSLVSGWTSGGGGAGQAKTNGGTGSGGGGGASALNNGSAGQFDGGASSSGTSTKMDANQLAFLANLLRGVCCGGGGGGGGGGGRASGTSVNTYNGGAGGAGGGALVWYIGGNLTLGSGSIIRCDGVIGIADSGGSDGHHGGGGGSGAGGTIIIIVAGSITNSGVTLSADGVTGIDDDQDGGSGGDGKVIIMSLTDGTLIVSA